MPSKKRKYNARFPAGRIKKIMQTDEEVGKVAQAVPIIISRTLELFVESLLSKAMQVTMARNAKTLSPSHVKQCILAESRFDFLQDLVKDIPDVSVAEEKEMSTESSPNCSRFSEMSVPPRRIAREDSNSSSSSDIRQTLGDIKPPRTETITSITSEKAMDLSKRHTEVVAPELKIARPANFYQETLNIPDEIHHQSVITLNPTYATPQPSTSSYTTTSPVDRVHKTLTHVPKTPDIPMFNLNVRLNNNTSVNAPKTPVTPILNIDFTKSLAKPEIKLLDSGLAIVGVKSDTPQNHSKVVRQNSKSKSESKRTDSKPASSMNIDHLSSGNLQIDEDYDT